MNIKWLVIIVVIALLCGKYVSGNSYQEAPIKETYNKTKLQSIDHSAWQEILADYLVTDDLSQVHLVDYESLLEEEYDKLQKYIKTLSHVDVSKYSTDEQFAYWINLYNALTVNVILDNYPIDSITNVFGAKNGEGPWDMELLVVQGKKLTLNDIEHKILRKNWNDYRIHFAVNCASIGCPNLSNRAFTAQNYSELLDIAATDYLQHPRAFNFVDDHLYLSSIFDWYKSDFGKNEQGMLQTLAKHLTKAQQKKLELFDGKIQYGYDWALNDYKVQN